VPLVLLGAAFGRAVSAWLQLGTPPAPLTALGLAIVVAGLAGSVSATASDERREARAVEAAPSTAPNVSPT
jgi:hypothetical protein